MYTYRHSKTQRDKKKLLIIKILWKMNEPVQTKIGSMKSEKNLSKKVKI